MDNNTTQSPVLEWRAGQKKEEVLKIASPRQTIAVFDTETTGFNYEGEDRIIEFSVMVFNVMPDLTLQKEYELQQYIKPPFSVSAEITELTGITNEMLEDKPSEDAVADDILNILGSVDVVCGHNVSFDINFVKALFARNNMPECKFNNVLDTLSLARDLIVPKTTENYKLGTLLTALGLAEGVQFHSAIDDVYATSLLLQTLLKQYAAQTETVKPLDLKVSRISYWEKADKSIQRIYVTTNSGSLYICKGTHSPVFVGSKDVDMTRVDREQFISKVMTHIGATTEDELLRFRGKVDLIFAKPSEEKKEETGND